MAEKFQIGKLYRWSWLPPIITQEGVFDLEPESGYGIVYVDYGGGERVFISEEIKDCVPYLKDASLIKLLLRDGTYTFNGDRVISLEDPKFSPVYKPDRKKHAEIERLVKENFGIQLQEPNWKDEEREYSNLIKILEEARK